MRERQRNSPRLKNNKIEFGELNRSKKQSSMKIMQTLDSKMLSEDWNQRNNKIP